MSARPPALRVRRDPAELARVRRAVGAWAEAAGLDDRATHRAQLAVDEAVANAIEHGMQKDGRVTVRGVPGRGRLAVTVRYRGPRFDPTTAPTPEPGQALRERAEHGYGLHLIRRLAEVSYEWSRGANEVELVIRTA